jgi:hypothetical protein
MKKLILSLVAVATIALTSFGQAPEGFKYQAVVRDAGNTILNNQAVGLRLTIQQGAIGGTTVYAETFAPTTNAYGLVNLEIGNGTVVSGTFANIDWSAGPYFMETAVDVSGGTNYSVMGTSQLMSVPYALYAKTSGNGQGPAGPQGIQGPAGEDGTNGLDGATGPQGAEGLDGINGLSAYQVWIGLGNTGTETDFINSLTGPQGAQGIQGIAGINGAVGATGPQGIQGIDGPQGPAGNNGMNGANGLDGNGITSTTDNGDGTFTFTYNDGSTFTTFDLTGPQGAIGAQGPQGIQGIDGPQGPVGNNGMNGTNGLDGNGIASTTDNSDGTFTLTYDDGSTFTTSDLTGPQGAIGAQGPQGIQGPAGNDGVIGAQGPQGPAGNDGVQGLQGIQGPTGNDGAIGAQGPAGQGGVTTAGTGISVTGTGTVADPYIVSESGCGLTIGQTYQGGIIFYLDASGCHGLISAPSDQSVGIQWYNGSYTNTTAFASCVGCGDGNTSMIVFNQGSGSYAGKLCYDLSLGGYDDWYLPSKYELNLMYRNIGQGNALGLGNVGGFANNGYWSSTEVDNGNAWGQGFPTGFQGDVVKANGYNVRAVRAF